MAVVTAGQDVLGPRDKGLETQAVELGLTGGWVTQVPGQRGAVFGDRYPKGVGFGEGNSLGCDYLPPSRAFWEATQLRAGRGSGGVGSSVGKTVGTSSTKGMIEKGHVEGEGSSEERGWSGLENLEEMEACHRRTWTVLRKAPSGGGHPAGGQSDQP